jgi:uncharacterized protein (DUF486 family)
MKTILLLLFSNIFMTFAWYGHLKFTHVPVTKAVLISWAIAFVEYCFMVPANRMGHVTFSTVELKIIQEIITLVVFSVFAVTYMQESLRWNHAAAFTCLGGAAWFTFRA